jgi:hypothetical protein
MSVVLSSLQKDTNLKSVYRRLARVELRCSIQGLEMLLLQHGWYPKGTRRIGELAKESRVRNPSDALRFEWSFVNQSAFSN